MTALHSFFEVRRMGEALLKEVIKLDATQQNDRLGEATLIPPHDFVLAL